ncbi:MAG: GTPase, partial [Planctomycetota bacterium]
PDELQRRLSAANEAVASLIEQTAGRSLRQSLPRVVLTGPPNAGKSSLFNSLRQRCRSDTGDHPGALVSPQAGTTRDSVTALLEADGVRFELIDTAGREQTNSTAADQSADEPTPIETAADQQAYRDTQQADLRLVCHAATPLLTLPDSDTTQEIAVLTKADLATGNREPGNWLKTSSQTGEGLDALVTAIADRLRGDEASHAGFLAATAERCRQSLELAQQSLHAACEVAVHDQHELVAFELRTVLDTLGQVTGAVVTDDLLDRIFSQFCIGK